MSWSIVIFHLNFTILVLPQKVFFKTNKKKTPFFWSCVSPAHGALLPQSRLNSIIIKRILCICARAEKSPRKMLYDLLVILIWTTTSTRKGITWPEHSPYGKTSCTESRLFGKRKLRGGKVSLHRVIQMLTIVKAWDRKYTHKSHYRNTWQTLKQGIQMWKDAGTKHDPASQQTHLKSINYQ